MKCPTCDAEMQHGVAVVKMKPSFVTLLTGIGMNCYQHLWFVAADASDEASARAATISEEGELIQQAYQPGRACRCRDCGTVILVPAGAA